MAGAAVGAAVVALVLAACGQSDGSGQVSVGGPKTGAARAVVAAAAATEKAETGTFRISYVMVTDGDTSSNLSAISTGSFDRAAERWSEHTEASVPTSAHDPGSSGSYDGPSDTVRDGTTLYVRLSTPMSGNASKPWIATPVGEGEPVSPLDAVMPFGSTGPGPLDEITDLSSGVTDLGAAAVDGVDATHYQATITPQDQLRMRTSATGPMGTFDTGPSATDPADLPTVHVDVWIDGSGIVRRLTLHIVGLLGMSSSGSGSSDGSSGTTQETRQTGTMTMTLDLLTVNEPVHIEVPPRSQVMSMGPTCGEGSTTSTTSSSDGVSSFTCVGSAVTGSGVEPSISATTTTGG
jgi:hypothetical protein